MATTRKKIGIILASIVALILVLRLFLPQIVLRLVNNRLAEMPGYYGHVADIDIALLRGAYQLDSIYINKQDSTSGDQTPFFSASKVDLSVEWKALFKGSIVGEIILDKPMITFTKDKVEPKGVQQDSSSFKDLKNDLMPLRINRVEIREGTINYKDESSTPPVDVSLTNVSALALNLRNSYDSGAVLPASIDVAANVYEGTMKLGVKLNPLAEQPTFDLNLTVDDTNLVKLNDFFKAYAKVDVNKGTFNLYAEAAAKEGKFAGYAKPLIKDLDILGEEDRDDNVLRKMWEAIAGGVGELFENQPRDQVATKIPFEGELEDPNTGVWETIIRVLQNAFIRAIQPAIDEEIDLTAVEAPEEEKKNFLERIFEKKDKKKD